MNDSVPVPTCHVYLFKLAWHGSLATLYFHAFLLVLALVDRRYARLVFTRAALGYVVNVVLLLAGWLLARDTFVCRVVAPLSSPPIFNTHIHSILPQRETSNYLFFSVCF
jgi:hypothetical protein